MQRRTFIVTAAGAALAWPRPSQGQKPDRPVVGLLYASPFVSRYVDAFRAGLRDAGFIEGENVLIEYRTADGRFDRLPELAADLATHRVSVIAAPGNTMAALAAKSATETVPVVFGVSQDPVKLGLIASLAHPGGNATGINFFTTEVVAKRLGLLHELLPTAVRIAVLVNPSNASNADATLRELDAAARPLALKMRPLNASTSDEIDRAFATLEQERPDALFVSPDSFYNTRRAQLATLAARYAVPAVYSVREYVEVGGLMSYGTDIGSMFRQVGLYTGRILNGENPAELPVVQSTKFQLAINISTAKALGLSIPPTLLARADEVIE